MVPSIAMECEASRGELHRLPVAKIDFRGMDSRAPIWH